jgi:hypothetical protein
VVPRPDTDHTGPFISTASMAMARSPRACARRRFRVRMRSHRRALKSIEAVKIRRSARSEWMWRLGAGSPKSVSHTASKKPPENGFVEGPMRASGFCNRLGFSLAVYPKNHSGPQLTPGFCKSHAGGGCGGRIEHTQLRDLNLAAQLRLLTTRK